MAETILKAPGTQWAATARAQAAVQRHERQVLIGGARRLSRSQVKSGPCQAHWGA